MTRFWRGWLQIWCWAVLAFGVLLATAAVPGFDSLVRTVFTSFSSDPDNAAMFDQQAVRFGIGLQGALTIGWAITMFTLFSAADAAGAPAWRGMTLALVVWWLIDSAISLATGFALNALSNTLLLIAYLAPVLASGVLGKQTSA